MWKEDYAVPPYKKAQWRSAIQIRGCKNILVAGLIEWLVFALVDPVDLRWAVEALGLSRDAVYTLAFFAFWALAMLSSAMTLLLSVKPSDVNEHPTVSAH